MVLAQSFDPDDIDPALAELKNYSARVSQKRFEASTQLSGRQGRSPGLANRMPRSIHQAPNQVPIDAALLKAYASPLLPLRDRDMTALLQMFQHSQLDEIHADLLQALQRLLPEPCWEDDPLEFLQEYL